MKALALIESEMILLEPNYLLAEGESSQFQDSEARRKDTVIELDYGRDNNDNEKRTQLSNADKDQQMEHLGAQNRD